MKQRVIVYASTAAKESWDKCFLQLQHPATGGKAPFLLHEGSLQEINSIKPQYGAWIIDSNIQSDATLYLSTPIDPLFLALPHLECSRSQGDPGKHGVFQDAAQMFDENDECRHLCRAAEPYLSLLCDTKRIGEEVYFRLNSDRVIAWLKCKVEAMVAALTQLSGSYTGMSPSSLQAYAVGMLGEYLNDYWHGLLKAEFPSMCQDDEKSQPLVDATQQSYDPDYGNLRKRIKIDQKAVAKQKAQEAKAEKKLALLKRETAGMKKMSSFFSRRTK